MTKQNWQIIGLSLFIIIIYQLFWSGSGITEIVSTDGKAILQISKNALPEGTSMEDIKITGEMVEGFYGLESEPVYAYNLEPDGLRLVKPATIILSKEWYAPVPGAAVKVPILIHKSGDDFEIINDAVADFSTEKSSVEVSGDIMHFSHIAFSDDPSIFTMFLSVPLDLKLKESGPVKFRTSHSSVALKDQLHIPKRPNYILESDTWEVRSNAIVTISGSSFSPKKIKIPSKAMKRNEEYAVTQNVTCVKKGEGSFIQSHGEIAFVADLKMLIPYYWGTNHDNEPGRHSNGSVHNDDEFHHTSTLENLRMTAKYPFGIYRNECGQEQLDQFQPYLYICVDGTSRSGSYYIDPDTNEKAVNEEGYYIDGDTRTAVTAYDMCPGWKKPN